MTREVAMAFNAAKQLDADQVVMVLVNFATDLPTVRMVSYGATETMLSEAGQLANRLFWETRKHLAGTGKEGIKAGPTRTRND